MAVVLGQYQLGEVIGKGAFGSVHRALNVKTGDFVAVKKYDVATVPPKDLQAIVEESTLMKSLVHENIVQFLGAGKDGNSLYLVMEFIENGSVTKIMKTFGHFPESLVRLYTEQVLKGLRYLHKNNVVHRDIKGCNILVTKEGTAKLADFGVSSRLDETQKRFSVVGTPYWMAPEVIEMTGCGLASDIWSVGCTIVELLTGSPPYYELASMTALFRIVKDDHPPLPEGLSPQLEDFLRLCFRKDPAQRPTCDGLLSHPWVVNPEFAAASKFRPFAPVRERDADPADEDDLSLGDDGLYGEDAERARQEMEELRAEVGELKDKVKSLTLKLLMAVAERGEALKLAKICASRELLPQQKTAIKQRIAHLETSSKVDIEEEKELLSRTEQPGPSRSTEDQQSHHAPGGAGGREGGRSERSDEGPPGGSGGPAPAAAFSMQPYEPELQDVRLTQDWVTSDARKVAAETKFSWNT